MVQILVLVIAWGALAFFGWSALAGPSPSRESARRLKALRYRHSENTKDKVEAQMRKAVAARRPRARVLPGSSSRIDALVLRLHRSGLPWTVTQYAYISLGIGAFVTVLILAKTRAPFLSLGIGIFVGGGLPHFIVNWFIKRRLDAFTVKFSDAIELLVRGLRSGLPVTETISVVAHEVPGPVGEEFKLITERIKIGKTLEEALQNTADRLGMPEFNFFCITLAIQRETGGNLAETLANLADVLRKRAQMKLKVKAMSSESKASAYIVGALPFIVFAMIWWINPRYVNEFFIDDRLIVAGIVGLVWMGIGGFIMAKMVSFEI